MTFFPYSTIYLNHPLHHPSPPPPPPSAPHNDDSQSTNEPFSPYFKMSILRLFVKNNPEGCPIFEVSCSNRKVLEYCFPRMSGVDGIDLREDITPKGSMSGLKNSVNMSSSSGLQKDQLEIITSGRQDGSKKIDDHDDDNTGAPCLHLDNKTKSHPALEVTLHSSRSPSPGPVQNHPTKQSPLLIARPSLSPTPSSSTSPSSARPKPNPNPTSTSSPSPSPSPSLSPYILQSLLPTTHNPPINLSSVLNNSQLKSSEQRYLILPADDEKGMRMMMIRLGEMEWRMRKEVQRCAMMGSDGNGNGNGHGSGRGDDGTGNESGSYRNNDKVKLNTKISSGFGVSSTIQPSSSSSSRNRFQNPSPTSYNPITYGFNPSFARTTPRSNHLAPPNSLHPPSVPTISNSNPNTRSRSQSQHPHHHHHPPKPPHQRPIPPFLWPTDLSPNDRTLFIKPHQLLDYLLAKNFKLLGSHVEAYGLGGGGICDVHTFVGLRGREVRELMKEEKRMEGRGKGEKVDEDVNENEDERGVGEWGSETPPTSPEVMEVKRELS